MTRADLEAVIRRELTATVRRINHTGMVTEPLNLATDVILTATDEYVTAEVGLLTPAERRRVLEATVEPPVVHWLQPTLAPRAACHGRATKAPVTTVRGNVTCGTCKESRTWREAP